MFKLSVHLHGAEIEKLDLRSGNVYTFGRGESCDVKLDQQPGISRTHFKLSEESGIWVVEVVSKVGELFHLGQPVRTIHLEANTVFKLAGYDFRFEESKQELAISESTSQMQAAAGQDYYDSPNVKSSTLPALRDPSQVPLSNQPFNGNDEATRVMQTESTPEIPYLRIVEPGGVEDLIRLEGRTWIAGREEGSSILLNDKKASRRQFELSSTPQGYFVRDLESSNGTLLNGNPLVAQASKGIRSGDVIQVGSVLLHFEVRDPSFEKRLMVVPEEVRSEAPIVLHNTYEMINYPVASGPGGAVRLITQNDGKNKLVAYAMGEDLADESAKKKRRLTVGITAIVVLFAGINFVDFDSPPKKAAVELTGFGKLKPADQKSVKQTFVLAKNLYMQKKLALAADQLAKLHTLLPEGYENSIAMADDCRDASLQEENLRFIEEQKKKQAENARIVNETLARCDRLASTTLDPEELRSCMMPALERAPDDPRVRDLQQKVDRRIAERNAELQNNRHRAGQLAKGRALYAKAVAFERDGQDLDAIDAYKNYIARGYPDPDGSRDAARKSVLSLTQRLSTKVDDAIRTAETAFTQQNFKEALLLIKKAKALDPLNEKAAEMNARIRRELKTKLKDIYEDSIIKEGIGDVESGAKPQWRKILETDLPDGEYYIKAKNKLRSYGAL